MKISISQIKTAHASIAKRAGQYILWIKEDFESDSLPLGNMFENWLITGKDNDELLKWVVDLDKFNENYQNLKHNTKGLEVPVWEYQKKIEGELFGLPYVWYIDIFNDDCIYEIKTVSKVISVEWDYPNMRSWLSYMDEYKLQMRAYMKTTWVKKAKIIAIGKFLYKDERSDHKIIDIDWSDELDQEMTRKFTPTVDKMKDLYNRFGMVI